MNWYIGCKRLTETDAARFRTPWFAARCFREENGSFMTAFAELGLSEAALAAVERMGYDSPTPVQEQSIPYILEGRDVIAAASTGTTR